MPTFALSLDFTDQGVRTRRCAGQNAPDARILQEVSP